MRKIIVFILCIISTNTVFSQCLSPERVSRIKSSTVRIIVEGGISIGTGFFVNDKGLIITCWHVVLPAFQNNKRTYIQFSNNDIVEVGVPNIYNSDTLFGRVSVGYDFCILAPMQ